MPNSVTMKYGDYSFSPVPMITIDKSLTKTAGGEHIGDLYGITLNGYLTASPDQTGGIIKLDQEQDALLTALNIDGKRFRIMCDSTEILNVYPRVMTIHFAESNDNWVYTTPFTVNLEIDAMTTGNDSTYTGHVSDATDSWVLEFADGFNYHTWDLNNVTNQDANFSYSRDTNPYVLRMSHSVSAVGKSHYKGDGAQTTGVLNKYPWEEARDFVVGRLGSDTGVLANSGIINIQPTGYEFYNHMRTVNQNELAGGYDVTESWLVKESGQAGVHGNATEDFTITISNTFDSPNTRVHIDGTIQGLESRSYGNVIGDFSTSETKYAAATGYWANVENKLYPRCQMVSENKTTRTLHPSGISTSIAHNPNQGTISYDYEFDDRPLNCVAGSLHETINISHKRPTDIFASLAVLGRAAGPILQDIGTVTEGTYAVNIEVVMQPSTGCTYANLVATQPYTSVAALLCTFQTHISDTYATYFKIDDQESWEPKTGRYSRGVTWTYTYCNSSPDTSLC